MASLHSHHAFNSSSSHFLHDLSDENFAYELQLQEAITSSLSSTPAEIPNNNSSPKPQDSICTICTDAKLASEMFTNGLCSHTFCTDCISKYIAAKLEDSMAVKCPQPKCGTLLEPEMCRSFIPKEVLERWGDALFEAMILKWKRLNCPFKDCSAPMIYEGDEKGVTAVECLNCWRLFCAQCKVGWHGDMECREFEKVRKENTEDMMTMKLADEKKWKKCPNCKVYVEKTVGCVHIICRCGTQFCYSCGAKWGGGHACPNSAYEHSMMEAEYVVACETTKKAVWLRQFLAYLEVVPNMTLSVTLYCDNTGVVENSKEPCNPNEISLEHNIADPFTKALTAKVF
ncbi:probable E3 ubiquitin-protein ligase RNF144A-A [Benincasa hispida]|uniref:probable E3 ubiquitin-protein ligase RNF144A-A n=1 Tax=Benincasa hispida TaxID=102211 RepID=UPI0018FFEB0E|nr:probable E3 ubiquitin-protein ligase RNF144A-A [Benincasa hispida]